jgi:hypothetical protein
MNKYRLSVMGILMVVIFLYIIGGIEITEQTNFSLTLSALIFSISSVIDTYAKENKWESRIRFILDSLALGVAIILPNITYIDFLKKFMDAFDSNVLLLLALFFTMAGQWSIEIKLKDIRNERGKKK